jgi:hypothetical protein
MNKKIVAVRVVTSVDEKRWLEKALHSISILYDVNTGVIVLKEGDDSYQKITKSFTKMYLGLLNVHQLTSDNMALKEELKKVLPWVVNLEDDEISPLANSLLTKL